MTPDELTERSRRASPYYPSRYAERVAAAWASILGVPIPPEDVSRILYVAHLAATCPEPE